LHDGRELLVLSGTVIIDYRATQEHDWDRDTFHIHLDIPETDNQRFVVEDVAPFVSLASIQSSQSDGQSALAAWAVDEIFTESIGTRATQLHVGVKAAIQRRESKSVIYRLAYHVTAVGKYDELRDEDIVIVK
jgi:hypothetical protein